MTAKEYLQQLWVLDRRIEIKSMELKRLQAEVGIRQMPDNQEHVVGSGHPQDPVPDTAIRIAEMQQCVNRLIRRYVSLKVTITSQIEGMESQTYQDILTCRYVLMMNWDDVSRTMKYTVQHCHRIHGRALQAFGMQYLKKM